MEDASLTALLVTAGLIGFVHTITGPDHYIPFVAMSRVGRWSITKTIIVTLACGVGHVTSSVAIGAIGIAGGYALGGMKAFETTRGDVAGWLLLGFGLAYFAWGVRRAIRNRPHTHVHAHADGVVHVHEHVHADSHVHAHRDDNEQTGSMTPWVLFTIFVFGPCEPVIPILMFPAAKLSFWGVAMVALVFGLCTLATMTIIVVAGYHGVTKLSLPGLARYSHAVAGFALAACGLAIQLGF